MADLPSEKALAEFIGEAQEIIESLERGLDHLEDVSRGGEADPDTLNGVFRAAHSLKGLSAMFGVERMASLAHALEDRLDAVRMGRRALDVESLRLLQAAPALFVRMIEEESARLPPATVEQAQQLAAGLRGQAAPSRSESADPIAELALEPEERSVLTEYEEHRLRANLERGAALYRARVAFPLERFDTDLEELKRSLKGVGEIVATLPSPVPVEPSAIGFDLLLGSPEPLGRVQAAAGGAVAVTAIARRGGPAAVPASAAAPVEVTTPGAGPSRGAGATPGTPAPTPPPAAPVPATAEGSLRSISQAVRVDIHKLDQLMNLVGELLLVKTSLLGIAQRLRNGEESTTLGLELHRESRALERKLNELQGGVLDVRMVPIGQIFDKLGRMVRKLARDSGKQLEFVVRGGEVELDKLIIEELSDSLMHIIRNALDHAIETPRARIEAGKPPSGRLTLSAAQKGNHAVVALSDDGVGIDEQRIRAVAVERGFLAAEAAALLSRREALNLIFLPGFSTAREVTALSGRGVGMDVVKTNIAAMSGIIDVYTQPGEGTRFEITLPVTLAIVRALIVGAAGRSYAVPLNSVLEIVPVDPGEVRTIEQREVVSLRGATLPLVRLARFFGHVGEPPPGPLFVVVVGLAHERLGLAVDGLVGQQDVVVKPLGRALEGVRGIAGATDLGSRRTILVLDVAAVIEEAVRKEALVEAAG